MCKLFKAFLWWFRIKFYIIRIVIHPSAGALSRRRCLGLDFKYVEEHTFLFAYVKKMSYLCIRKIKEVLTTKTTQL